MCCFDFDGELRLGSLCASSLEELFASPAYRRIRAFHADTGTRDDGLLCSRCDQLHAPDPSVVVLSTGFDPRERIARTSTTYADLG
jgi:hypothetical protein